MSLPPQEKDALESAIQRTVAAAALRRIRRLIEEDEADELRGKKFSGAVTGLVLYVMGVCGVVVLVNVILDYIATGQPSPFAAIPLMVGGAVIVFLLAGAYYFAVVLPGGIRRVLQISLCTSAAFALLIGAFLILAVPVTGCADGDDAMRAANFDGATRKLTTCMAFPNFSDSARVTALKTRASAYYKGRQFESAIADLEAAFKLQAAAEGNELRVYAVYLRLAGRLQDSLDAIARAEAAGGKHQSWWRIQYQRGLTLAALGRHEEAVSAFTDVLAINPRMPWTYWHRGLAYEALGKREFARDDFERYSKILRTRFDLTEAAPDSLPDVESKLREYATRK